MEKHRGRKMRQKRRGCEKEIEMQRHKNMKGDRGTSGGGGGGSDQERKRKKERTKQEIRVKESCCIMSPRVHLPMSISNSRGN